MRNLAVIALVLTGMMFSSPSVMAQFKTDSTTVEQYRKEGQDKLAEITQADSTSSPVKITLEEALKIALSENISVKVAEMDIQRAEYAKKGTYAALFPQIDLSGAYQRTIKKQVMYMDFDMSSIMGGAGGSDTGASGTEGSGAGAGEAAPEMPTSGSSSDGLEVGRWNTWSAGASAAMPLVNAQLWKSLKISGKDVELAVEKARSSRLEMVTQVKNAYYGVLLAKEVVNVYQKVYDNALENFEHISKKKEAEKATEIEYLRAKTQVANAIPNLYNAQSSVDLALWQLKAVMGIDLDMNMDVAGKLEDWAEQMFYDIHENELESLDNNTTMKQLMIQTEMLEENIKVQQYANIPSLALAFNFSMNAMTNDFNFSEYRWTPHSYVALSLNIPIFSGGKRHQQIRQAKNQYEQVKLQVDNTKRQLQIAVHQHLTTMETNMKSSIAAKDAISSAEKGYDVVKKSFELGHSTLIEVNDAQLALTQAELSSLQAIYNFLTAKSQLEQVLGKDFIGE